MEYFLIGFISSVICLVSGGALGFLYGRTVQQKAQAVEHAAITDIKRVL